MHATISSALIGLHYACAGAVPAIASLTTLITLNSSHKAEKSYAHRKTWTNAAQTLTFATYTLETIIVILGNGDAFGADNAHLVHLLLAALTWATISGLNATTPASLVVVSAVTVMLELPLIVFRQSSHDRSEVFLDGVRVLQRFGREKRWFVDDLRSERDMDRGDEAFAFSGDVFDFEEWDLKLLEGTGAVDDLSDTRGYFGFVRLCMIF